MGQPQEVSPDADSSGAVQVLRGLSPEKGPILTQMACFGLPGFADPIVVEDLERTEFAVQAARTGMRAVLAAPIVIEGYRIGGLALVAHEPRHWSHEEIHLVEAVGQQLGTTAERLRLFYEVRMHAEQLEVALQQSQKLEQLKSEFIQNVSHELRTPLGLIRGYSELLNAGELGPLPPEQQSVVEIIVRRAQMLSELVEDITVILDAETRPLLRDRVAVDELARAAVEDFRIAADRSKLTLSLEIPSTVPQVFGQTAYLRRVLDNLIGNAVKFTTEGQSVTVRVGHEDSRVFLQVSDTGKGVPPEEQERIFERFYQVDGGIRRRYGGVGLGLALVKQVVESLGGEVTLQSEVGRGSTFTVWLPVAEEQ
jgi:signal transduction histidine kinase